MFYSTVISIPALMGQATASLHFLATFIIENYLQPGFTLLISFIDLLKCIILIIVKIERSKPLSRLHKNQGYIYKSRANEKLSEKNQFQNGGETMKLYNIIRWSVLLTVSSIGADNRIVMYLRHAPQNILDAIQKTAHEELTKAQTPAAQAKELLEAKVPALLKPSLGGIAAIYGGYFTVSRPDGLISFPLRHATPKVYVAVTPSIQLIRIKGNTFSHRSYCPPPIPTALFSMQQEVDDKNRTFWRVKTESLPDDLVVNPLTIVLLTEPNNIVIADGNFLTGQNPQLVLPEPMVVSNKGNDACLINAMSMRQHFEGITFEDKKAADTCVQTMIQNI